MRRVSHVRSRERGRGRYPPATHQCHTLGSARGPPERAVPTAMGRVGARLSRTSCSRCRRWSHGARTDGNECSGLVRAVPLSSIGGFDVALGIGTGVGLTANYTSLVLSNPRCVPELVRLLPMVYRDTFHSDGLQSGGLPADFPPELLQIKRRAMLTGPVAYLRARLESRRLARKWDIAPTPR